MVKKLFKTADEKLCLPICKFKQFYIALPNPNYQIFFSVFRHQKANSILTSS